MTELLKWRVYEIASKNSSLNGVMLRGRIRKFGLKNTINVLAENTEDIENGVRFATLTQDSGDRIVEYVLSIIPGATIKLVEDNLVNPVLSKLKVNREDRYSL